MKVVKETEGCDLDFVDRAYGDQMVPPTVSMPIHGLAMSEINTPIQD